MIGAIEALAGIVTVAIPARNRASLLQATLRTVAAQTVAPAEIIVADDGSTDATQAVAEASGARVLSKRGGGWGSAGARNAALAEASGEFIFFLDSDDLLLPIALERLGGALLSAPGAPFAYGRALAASRESDGWRPEGLIAPISDPSADPFAVLFARNAVPACGALVRTEEARAVGGYDETMPFSEDQDFFVRLALRGDPVSVPEVVAVHRRHPGNKQTAATRRNATCASPRSRTRHRSCEDTCRRGPGASSQSWHSRPLTSAAPARWCRMRRPCCAAPAPLSARCDKPPATSVNDGVWVRQAMSFGGLTRCYANG